MRTRIFYNTNSNNDGSNYFLIPDDCSVVWVTGCGGGGGGTSGAYAQRASGGGGGSAAPCFIDYPLIVKPNGILSIYVGKGCTGGGATGTSSQIGEASGGGSFLMLGCIAGDLIGPEVWAYAPRFSLGCGSTTAGPQIESKGNGTYTFCTFISDTWASSSNNTPIWCMGPFSAGESGVDAFGNSGAYGATAGKDIFNGFGFDVGGQYGAPHGYGESFGQHAFAEAGFSGEMIVGAGGHGGACVFGRGGAPGVSGDGRGGHGFGFGAGGAGAMGESAPAGDGAPGFIMLRY